MVQAVYRFPEIWETIFFFFLFKKSLCILNLILTLSCKCNQSKSKKMAKLILTAGLTGAGKSTIIRKIGLSEMLCANSDSILEAHPDYNPKRPELLHEWAKIENQKQIYKFMAEGSDFIIDGTGTNVERYAKYINDARELGYEIEMIYVQVKLETAIERNAKRERTVPVEVIYEKAAVIETTVQAIGSMCDKFVTINND